MRDLLALVTALALSLAIIPVMVYLAPSLGMMDKPNERKVHDKPIPRVGGWGIILGALISIVVWIQLDGLMISYILGSVVLLVFGALDDRKEMGHYFKFLGQFIAVFFVVFYGGLVVTRLPFIHMDPVPGFLGISFTVISMVGMINAINHSDGLDGLAGGESMLSLCGIGFVSYLAGGHISLVLAVACIGGILGFLRHNTHPGTVFMGDAGSQFLGFTLGFLAILLTQRIDTTLSPAVAIMLLGFPIVDIIVVLWKRIRGGLNWFRATKNHVHHRLLNLGFEHTESVVIIYTLQSLIVLSGVLLCYQNNWLIVLVYLIESTSIYYIIRFAEKRGWQAHHSVYRTNTRRVITSIKNSKILFSTPRRILSIAIPLYLIGGSVWIGKVPSDFGLVAAALFLIMLLEHFIKVDNHSLLHRGIIYLIAAFIVYLVKNYPGNELPWVSTAEHLFFVMLALITMIAVRFSPKRRKMEFRTTAMDYIMIFVVVMAPLIWNVDFGGIGGSVIVQLIIIFYGCELLITEGRKRWSTLGLSSLATVAVLAIRSLL